MKDGCLWDTNGHILYSPLPCCVPLSGFEKIRFCVSQYDDKDRVLLRNLCFVLGAKFVEKLTKKVTHLICKFSDGTKYEAACKWGIHSVTAEWIYECVRQVPSWFCCSSIIYVHIHACSDRNIEPILLSFFSLRYGVILFEYKIFRVRLFLLICIAQKKLQLKTERRAYALSVSFLLKPSKW